MLSFRDHEIAPWLDGVPQMWYSCTFIHSFYFDREEVLYYSHLFERVYSIIYYQWLLQIAHRPLIHVIKIFMYHSHPSKGKLIFLQWRCPSSAALLSIVAGVHQIVYFLWAKLPSSDLVVLVLLIIITNTCRFHMPFITLMDFVISSFDYS